MMDDYAASKNPANTDKFAQLLEWELVIGNVSTWYKFCWSVNENNIMNLYYYMLQYETPLNYAIYLLPNVLSYAFVINSWITRLQDMDKNHNTTGLVYYYCMIIKNLLFFQITNEGDPLNVY